MFLTNKRDVEFALDFYRSWPFFAFEFLNPEEEE